MYQFRTFRNTDPPWIVNIWQSQPPQRSLVQPVTSALFEQCIFSKPYFDPAGLIIVTKDTKPIGFAHAGFGSDETGSWLDTQEGTTYRVMMHADHRDSAVEEELLHRSEAFLHSHGAAVLYGGGIRPLDGFYLGLYGGSELPGILSSDPSQQNLFARCGYRPISRVVVLHCDLVYFRPSISWQVRECSRRCKVQAILDPAPSTWWEACTTGSFDCIAFGLYERGIDSPSGQARFWFMEPLATAWGIKIAGLYDLHIDPDRRQLGMATHLLNKALTGLRDQGFALVEVQTMQENEPALALYRKLGFSIVDHGSVYRKESC
ncbi:MAG: GNAT family N-acetyltransferase [Pirellulales bacterium]|nr:GNAT family N-acetyltransferase [Pirellulales bacterium]